MLFLPERGETTSIPKLPRVYQPDMRLPVIIINDCWEYIIEVEVEDKHTTRDDVITLL